jgi:methionine-rich copper-binding protein CopC
MNKTTNPRIETHRSRLTRFAAFVGTALFATIGLVVPATPVHAHAGVSTTTPTNGAALTSAPRTVGVTFNEHVTTSAKRFQLLDAAGRIVATTWKPEAGGARQTLTPRKKLPAGAYALRWSVTSEDGHIVTGAVSFTVATKNATGPAAALQLKNADSTVTATLGSKRAGRATFTPPTGNHTTVEFKHKLLGATIRHELTGGPVTVVLPMKGTWTVTLVERPDTYTESRRSGTITLG